MIHSWCHFCGCDWPFCLWSQLVAVNKLHSDLTQQCCIIVLMLLAWVCLKTNIFSQCFKAIHVQWATSFSLSQEMVVSPLQCHRLSQSQVIVAASSFWWVMRIDGWGFGCVSGGRFCVLQNFLLKLRTQSATNVASESSCVKQGWLAGFAFLSALNLKAASIEIFDQFCHNWLHGRAAGSRGMWENAIWHFAMTMWILLTGFPMSWHQCIKWCEMTNLSTHQNGKAAAQQNILTS